MARTALRQMLEWFERNPEGISLPALARELGLSQGQAQNLVEFWVRKGRLRLAETQTDCGCCADKNGCPILSEMPRYYEFVLD